jgi:tetratricopeptide (TPR) repeat protein
VARIWVHYLGLVVWPARLSADYSYNAFPVSTMALDPRALAAAALLIVLAVLAGFAWRARSLIGFGAAWWAITLLPVSHLIPYSELLAEHYLYLPMVGAAFVVAGAIDGLAARFPERRRALAVAVLLLAVAAGWRTVVRNEDWRDPMSLWKATAEAVPGCARARFNLGQAYFEITRLDDAEREWLAAAEIRPQDPEIAIALATLYYRTASHEPATAQIDRARALKPGDAQVETLAGWIALDRGDPANALGHFDAALAVLPPERSEAATLGRRRAELALGPTRQGVQRMGAGGAKN